MTTNAGATSRTIKLASARTLIGGRRYGGDSAFDLRDRFTGELVAEVSNATRAQVAEAVRLARSSLRSMPDGYERSAILMRAAQIMRAREAELTETIVTETGFTYAETRGEIARGLDTLETSAEEAKRVVGEMIPMAGNPGQGNRLAFTIRQPVGIVCAITPFNSPFNAVLHKVGPAIAAGNAIILKPSGYTPLTSSFICDALLEAGFPPALVALVHGAGAQVGGWLLEERDIGFYAFTGSTRVGREIQALAGARRTQLELGSIAATIVCGDADLDLALPQLVRASFRKAGQVCTSIQRLYVASSRLQELTERFRDSAARLVCGDPRAGSTDVGPMISAKEADRVGRWIEEAKAGGARVEAGGKWEGNLLQPTVLSRARPGMDVIEKEVFAPLVNILPFDDLTTAISDINALPFGLATGIFTNSLDSAFLAARALRVGSVHVNATSNARTDCMPYGGLKDSGHGYEGPKYAIREMTEEKVVTFSMSAQA